MIWPLLVITAAVSLYGITDAIGRAADRRQRRIDAARRPIANRYWHDGVAR